MYNSRIDRRLMAAGGLVLAEEINGFYLIYFSKLSLCIQFTYDVNAVYGYAENS